MGNWGELGAGLLLKKHAMCSWKSGYTAERVGGKVNVVCLTEKSDGMGNACVCLNLEN